MSKITGKSGQCILYRPHCTLSIAQCWKVQSAHLDLSSGACVPLHCKARKAFVGPAMHWNAQEVYFITSDEVASCSKTISHKESNILTKWHNCVWSLNVLCNRAPTMSREQARPQDNDIVLSRLYSFPSTNISSSYGAGRNISKKWYTTVLACFLNRDTLKWPEIYKRSILCNMRRRHSNEMAHCAGRIGSQPAPNGF